MKTWLTPAVIASVAAFSVLGADAQTNTPASVKVPSPSPLPPIMDVRPVSALLKPSPQSSANSSSTTKLPVLIPVESEVIKSKSGVEYRGLLVKSQRPAGAKFNPLQLINPFAPMSYGIAGSSTGSTPRAFRDERTHEPVGITIISVSR